jgi:hypothetical protein
MPEKKYQRGDQRIIFGILAQISKGKYKNNVLIL